MCVYASVLSNAAGQGTDLFVLFPISAVINKAHFVEFRFSENT